MNGKIEVSPDMAKFFMEMCIGQYTGHMSAIPHNPLIYGLMNQFSVVNGQYGHKEQFVKFLRGCADALEAK